METTTSTGITAKDKLKKMPMLYSIDWAGNRVQMLPKLGVVRMALKLRKASLCTVFDVAPPSVIGYVYTRFDPELVLTKSILPNRFCIHTTRHKTYSKSEHKTGLSPHQNQSRIKVTADICSGANVTTTWCCMTSNPASCWPCITGPSQIASGSTSLSMLHCEFHSAEVILRKPPWELILAKPVLSIVWTGSWTKTGSKLILKPQCGHSHNYRQVRNQLLRRAFP